MIATHSEKKINSDKVAKSAADDSSKFNIIILGKTGVGKSTLINSLFRRELTKTGSGRPVTQHIEEFTEKGHPLTIVDTKGLELQDHEKAIDELTEFINERSIHHNENKHIHAAWLCIHEDSRRIEQAEKKLCEMLKEKNIPVIVAITKSLSANDFREQVIKALPSAAAVVQVKALAERISDGENSITIKEKGLATLIKETSKLLPAAKQQAYANVMRHRNKAQALGELVALMKIYANTLGTRTSTIKLTTNTTFWPFT